MSVSCYANPPHMDLLPHVDMLFSKKKRSSSSFWMEIMCTTAVEGFCHYVLISKFLLPNCSGFEMSENQDLAANEYLAEPFEKLWPTLFVCVQNFTSVFMVETAQSVVVTAQRGLSNCAAAQARSLEGTLVGRFTF